MAKREVLGAKEALKELNLSDSSVDIFQIPETLPAEILELMHAPPKPSDIPVADLETLKNYDGILFGFSTRFGTYPAQFKSFWDASGAFWAQGTFHGKFVGLFFTTAGMGGGQESVAKLTLSSFVHHGMVYVPLGYKNSFAALSNLEEVHGGSPWGAGAIAGGDGSRLPSELELELAFVQGKSFAQVVAKSTSGKKQESGNTTTTTGSSATDINAQQVNSEAAASEAKPVDGEQPISKAKEESAGQTPPTTDRTAQQVPQTKTEEKKKKKFGCCTVM